MLPGVDPDGRQTGQQMILYCLALIAARACPGLFWRGRLCMSSARWPWRWYFLRRTLALRRERSHGGARGVLRASLVYLPGLLVVACWSID